MLGKLIKYDLKSNYLYLLVGYAVYIVLTIGFVLCLSTMDFSPTRVGATGVFQVFGFLSVTILWVLSLAALAIMTYILIIYRFYSNMVSDQGYLTLTLPVSTRTHILAKLISGMVLELVTGLVLMAGVGIVIFSVGDETVWEEIFDLFGELWRELGTGHGVLYLINTILSGIRGLLLIYFSICVGQLFARHKVWGAIGTYFGIVIVLEILVTVAALVAGSYGGFSTLEKVIENGMSWGNTIYLLVQILVYFFLGAWILEKKANLE